MDLRIYILVLKSNIPETGLTLADFQVNIWSVEKSDQTNLQIITNEAMDFEVGGGFYGYYLSDVDYSTYDYFARVYYSGAEILDSLYWVNSRFDYAIQTPYNLISSPIYAGELGVPKEGLTLSDFEVDVYRITKSDQSVTALVLDAAMTVEVGGGFYGYYLTSADFLIYDYLSTITYAGSETLDSEFWYGEITPASTGDKLFLSIVSSVIH